MAAALNGAEWPLWVVNSIAVFILIVTVSNFNGRYHDSAIGS